MAPTVAHSTDGVKPPFARVSDASTAEKRAKAEAAGLSFEQLVEKVRSLEAVKMAIPDSAYGKPAKSKKVRGDE